jgi:toxin HigB-1
MIKNFSCKYTEQLFGGGDPRQFRAFKAQAERKLQLLDCATNLEFLGSPPGNRLEALQGNRQGQYSIRINDQWRICFRFENGDIFDVAIIDYH